MTKTKRVILTGLLTACAIVLSRFLSVKTPIITISFKFIPVMLGAMLLGPIETMLISGLADLIGALLFPFGAYFVGYTVSSTLSGLIYGLFLKNSKDLSNKKFLARLIVSTFLVILISNTILNTLWIYITTKKALFAILPTRLLKQLVMFPIQVTIFYGIHLGFKKMNVYDKIFGTSELDEDLGMQEKVEKSNGGSELQENVKKSDEDLGAQKLVNNSKEVLETQKIERKDND